MKTIRQGRRKLCPAAEELEKQKTNAPIRIRSIAAAAAAVAGRPAAAARCHHSRWKPRWQP